MDLEKFDFFLKTKFTNFNENSTIGLVLNVNYIFFRNDMDLNFGGDEGIEHYFLVTAFDFNKNKCIIIDTYDTEKFECGYIYKIIEISYLLRLVQKDIDFCWIMDNEGVLSNIMKHNPNEDYYVKRNLNALVLQSKERINQNNSKVLSPIKWIFDNLENEDQLSVWTEWLNPKLNIFLTISLHRYFISDFFETYASRYSIEKLYPIVFLLKNLQLKLDQTKYMTYKLSVTNKENSRSRIKKDIQRNLHEMNLMELDMANRIVNIFDGYIKEY